MCELAYKYTNMYMYMHTCTSIWAQTVFAWFGSGSTVVCAAWMNHENLHTLTQRTVSDAREVAVNCIY